MIRNKKFKIIGEIPTAFIDFFRRIGIPMDNLTTGEQLSTEILETIAGDEDA